MSEYTMVVLIFVNILLMPSYRVNGAFRVE